MISVSLLQDGHVAGRSLGHERRYAGLFVADAILVREGSTRHDPGRGGSVAEKWNSCEHIVQHTLPLKNSNDEKSYESEDLEEMLEELAIAEEEELTNDGDSLDNIQWNEFANKQQSFTFTGKSGLLMDLPSNISQVKFFHYFWMKR
ncbi:hypothetical protein WN51_07402 [Melipona quadrifasciata]|uniref:Uncharacterized protein n=1 Tax=Melipona quadrifasciata TaxID=166423 RepID=A0A0N0BCJ1_9HYME|nr:hypothetical protein WN51_07402 [Melipona quadrifasciata]